MSEIEPAIQNAPAPIETFLDALKVRRPFAEEALRTCVLRIDEAAPALLEVLNKAADGQALTVEEEALNFRGLYILGAARFQAAHEPLLRLLRRPSDDLDLLLGDAIHEGIAKIIAGTFSGDIEMLFSAVTDRGTDEYVRAAILGAAIHLCWDGKIDRDRMRRFLEHFYEERLAADEDYVWIRWVEAIGYLGFRELKPSVAAAWDRLPYGVMEPRHFDQDLRDAERAPQDFSRFEPLRLGYIDDVVVELDWMRRSAAEDSQHKPKPAYLGAAPQPIINPMRHVGRNDPCPCGSGRKAKKCCLASA